MVEAAVTYSLASDCGTMTAFSPSLNLSSGPSRPPAEGTIATWKSSSEAPTGEATIRQRDTITAATKMSTRRACGAARLTWACGVLLRAQSRWERAAARNASIWTEAARAVNSSARGVRGGPRASRR